MQRKTTALAAAALLTACMLACAGGPTTLNAPAGDPPVPKERLAELPAELRQSANRLYAAFVDGNRVDYEGLAASEQFAAFQRLARALNDFDPATLAAREERLAFWINLYNAAVVHAALESGVQNTVREQDGFFDRYAYLVGGLTYTLNQIEHGILRGALFDESDPRARFIAEPLEPRLHFALNCASKSCPPINAYRAFEIDAQLDLATRAFLNQESEARVDEENHTIHLTRLFDWYEEDFPEGVLNFVLRHLNDGPARDYLEKHRDTILVKYNPYDWSLNR